MRTWILALACAALVPAMSGVARADVDGQLFDITVTSTVSGTFSGVLEFFGDGTFHLDVDDSAEEGFGTYTQSGTANTTVNAVIEDGKQYVGTYSAIANDPKQQGGIRGFLARRNNTPATINGQGFGNAGDVFRFSGTEILP
ncbi:MAG TPA: hypothetical protein VM165_11840 [Planctomycetaceae bacterium]|nr:hypothetical protein [Planctomycetaceae bacterium]